jgi:hypothetical protein
MRLLVAGGVTTNGYTKDVEIIDLLNPENLCANLDSLQNSMEKTAAMLVSEKPMICGNVFFVNLQTPQQFFFCIKWGRGVLNVKLCLHNSLKYLIPYIYF